LSDRHALLQFAEKQHGKLRRSDWKELNVKEFTCFGIDGSVQPAAFIIQPDHCLVDHDVIRHCIAGRL